MRKPESKDLKTEGMEERQIGRGTRIRLRKQTKRKWKQRKIKTGNKVDEKGGTGGAVEKTKGDTLTDDSQLPFFFV